MGRPVDELAKCPVCWHLVSADSHECKGEQERGWAVKAEEAREAARALRDHFAGQVAPGCMMAVVGRTTDNVAEEVFVAAKAAYRMADAMMKAREQGKDK